MCKTQIYETFRDFLRRENKDENGVSGEHAAAHPDWEKQNASNKRCWDCTGCTGCSDCTACSACTDCTYCTDCSDCSGCSACSGCTYCSNCSDCSDCGTLRADAKVRSPVIVLSFASQHPDRGGSAEDFKRVQEAKTLLLA